MYIILSGENKLAMGKLSLRRGDFTLVVGLACLGLGDLNGAKDALGQVLAADPANLIAYEELKRLG